MSGCPEFDWKGYALDELDADQRRLAELHLAECEKCREEVQSLGVTVAVMNRLPLAQPPRRIAFVSDPVFEQPWWRRMWQSGPQLGFASAALLAVAIFAHGLMVRGAVVAGPVAAVGTPSPQVGALRPVSTAPVRSADPAAVEAAIQAEVARRLPDAVNQEIHRQVPPMLASVRKEFEANRQADLKEAKDAFDYMQRKLTTVQFAQARFGGE